MKIAIDLDCGCGKTASKPISLECDDWGFDSESGSLIVARGGKKIFMAPWHKVKSVCQELDRID